MGGGAQIILKFFSGPHMGAEIPLTPGDVVVGSGENCDVILHDSTVAAHHVHITVPTDPGTPPVLVLRTLDAQAAFTRPQAGAQAEPRAEGKEQQAEEGKPAREEAPAEDAEGLYPFQGEVRWEAAVPVMLGTTCMAWQVEGEAWGDIGPAAFLDDRGRRPAGQAGEPEPEEEPAGPQPKILSPLAKRIVRIALALAVVLFLTVTFSGGPDTHLAEEMQDVLDDKGYGYLDVQQTNIGVTIQGVVPMQEDRGNLWKLAGNMDFPVFIDVQVREERAQAVRVALAVRGLFPTVALDAKDIVLTGYFRDKLIEGAAKIWIEEDIRDIGEIRSSMVYAAQVWPLFRDALVRHDLADLVVVRLHPGVVEVEGELDFEQRERLELAKKEVCDALNSPIAFWDSLTAPGFSAEWNASLNSSRRSAFAPDPALAQLFKDTHNVKGIKEFSAVPALRATPGASALTKVSPVSPLKKQGEGQGQGLDLSAAPSMDNALGGVVALVPTEPDTSSVTTARDAARNVLRTPEGLPLLERKGLRVLDDEGKPIPGHPAMIGGQEIAVARDEKGEIVRDEQGRPLLMKGGEIVLDAEGKPVPGHPAMAGDQDIAVARDEKGEVVRDAEGRPLLMKGGEMASDAEGRPAMKGGKVVYDEQGRPKAIEGAELLRDKEGRLVPGDERMVGKEPFHVARDEQGHILRDEQGGIALEQGGKILTDEHGEPLVGHTAMIGDAPVSVARDAEGNVLRDEEGRPLLMKNGELLRDKEGNLVPGRDDMFRDAPAAVILEPDGEPVLDKDGKPLVVEALRDEHGEVLRDKDGNPVFPAVARDKDGKVIRDAEGNPVLLGPMMNPDGTVMRDAEGNPVPTVVALDAEGNVVRDEQGNPLVVAPVLDEQGRVIRDERGRPVAPRVMTGADGRVARDKQGALILVPKDANNVDGDAIAAGAQEGEAPSGAADIRRFGSGMGFADAMDESEEKVDVLGGLTIVGVTIEPVPFVSMKDGQKFFVGGRLPSGYVIREISTEQLVLEKDGKIVTKLFERR